MIPPLFRWFLHSFPHLPYHSHPIYPYHFLALFFIPFLPQFSKPFLPLYRFQPKISSPKLVRRPLTWYNNGIRISINKKEFPSPPCCQQDLSANMLNPRLLDQLFWYWRLQRGGQSAQQVWGVRVPSNSDVVRLQRHNIANPHHNGLEAVTGSRSGALASLQALEKSSNLVLMALAGQLCTGPKYKAETPT